MIASLSNATSKRHYFGHDLWLMFPLGLSVNSLDSIAQGLKNCFVRFDSGMFGFIQTTEGNTFNKSLRYPKI